MKPGRNDPCPCGSGKKFKKCCEGRIATASRRALPTQDEIDWLVTLFKTGRYAELEDRAGEWIERYPHSGFLWKLLGMAQQNQGKDALQPLKKAVGLLPGDADVRNSLGNALHAHGQLDSAAESYRQALKLEPGHAEVYANLANTLQSLGRHEEAVTNCRRAMELKPTFAQAHNSLGNALHSLGRLEEAAASYRRASELAPSNAGVYCNLGKVVYELGTMEDAAACYQKAIDLSPSFAEAYLGLGKILCNIGKADEAVSNYHRAIEFKPNYAEAYNNLGVAYRNLGQFEEALASYRRAIEIKPAYVKAYYNMGGLLSQLGDGETAIAVYRHALEIDPSNREILVSLSLALRNVGKLDEALSICRSVLDEDGESAEAHCAMGQLLITLGQLTEAEGYLAKAVSLKPDNLASLCSLLSVARFNPDEPRFQQLGVLYEKRSALSIDDRITLNYTVGKAMAQVGEYGKSFEAYKEGNELKFSLIQYDEEEQEKYVETVRTVFDDRLIGTVGELANSMPVERDERVPIFILGMPRSGSTLIEQILSSHSDVFGAGELSMIGDLAHEAPSTPGDSGDLESYLIELRRMGQEYLERVWQHAPESRYIVDKMPGNYRYLGLIHLMLPNAKIIHSVRDPMDTCFSCYTLLFKSGQYYSYDLGTLGREYLRYRQLMGHWRSILPPGRVLDVTYEDVVANLEGESKRLLEYLGLDWDPSCLDFHENKRPVLTASVTQVRKPIYSTSVARWKPYEQYLSPLIETLHSAK